MRTATSIMSTVVLAVALAVPAACGDADRPAGERTSNCETGDCYCGNGIVEPGEECDGMSFDLADGCKGLGFSGGLLTCNNDCTYNTAACSEETFEGTPYGGGGCGGGSTLGYP